MLKDKVVGHLSFLVPLTFLPICADLSLWRYSIYMVQVMFLAKIYHIHAIRQFQHNKSLSPLAGPATKSQTTFQVPAHGTKDYF